MVVIEVAVRRDYEEIHVRSRSFVSLKVSLDEQIQQR